MPPEAYISIALCVLGWFSWDGWRRRLVVVRERLQVVERLDALEEYHGRLISELRVETQSEIKSVKARVDVVHGDIVDLGQMVQQEFQRQQGKQSMQAVSAAQFQPQTGLKPF